MAHKYAVAYASGFNTESFYRDFREPGETIEQIIESLSHVIPSRFAQDGHVFINGEEIPKKNWRLVKPQVVSDVPVAVTFHLAPLGGADSGSGGSKSFMSMFTSGLGMLFGGPAGGFMGSFLGGLGNLAISVVASLALRALSTPPEKPKKEDNRQRQSSLDGNSLEPGQAIPRVVGTHKVFPPFIANPLVSMDGEDEYVEAVLALAGPHNLSDIKAGEVNVLSAQDIQVETRQGWSTDTAITLVNRQSFTDNTQFELSKHDLADDQHVNLRDQTNPQNSIPVWHTVTSRQSPDEYWISLNMPNGLYDGDTPTNFLGMPIRIRFRQVGSATWNNCPELWIWNRKTKPIKKEIKFLWKTGWTSVTPPSNLGFRLAYRITKTQTAAPSSTLNPDTPLGFWRCHDHFSTVSNNTYTNGASNLQASNVATSQIKNTRLYQDRAEFWLDPAVFPKGQYEFQIKKGTATASWSFSDYNASSGVLDLTWYKGTSPAQVARNQENVNSDCFVNRVASIWNAHPCPVPNNLALIAVKAKNRQLPAISTVASGYVKDWDGAGWNNWVTTSNPAPHYYDVLTGSLNLDPLPTNLVDSASIVSWRTRCNTKNYKCNLVVDNRSAFEALTTLASCGYARPYSSEVWGIIQDDDKSAQAPVQVFTPRNSSNFKYAKAFNRPLDALRVTYIDRNILYTEQQTIKYDIGIVPNPRIEQIKYEGLTSQVEAEMRASFDMAQARLRATVYSLDADAEAIVCRNGDLVAIQTDVLTQQAGFGRIKTKTVLAGTITSLVFYDTISLGIGPNGIAIRLLDGSITTRAINETSIETDTVTFVVPLANSVDIDEDCLFAIGPSGSEYRRVIVTAIKPNSDFTCSMEFVDEANSLQTLI